MGRVRIPADVDREDRLVFGLTARQLAVLIGPAIALLGIWQAARHVLPEPVLVGVLAPLAVAVVTVAVGSRDRLSMDRYALAALRFLRAPRRLVPVGEGVPPLPAWARFADPSPVPAPLDLPARDVLADGVVDLGDRGASLPCAASTVNFAMRTPSEQDALAACFGRFANALSGAAQVVVRTEPVDVSGAVRSLLDGAAGLPHPQLEAAARSYATFLGELTGRRDVLRHRCHIVFHDPTEAGQAATVLARRAADGTATLAPAAVMVSAPEADQTTYGVLTASADPGPRALAYRGTVDEVIVGSAR